MLTKIDQGCKNSHQGGRWLSWIVVSSI